MAVQQKLIITIDGPSGAGKSTVARMLAKALGYAYIDTGAMYRGIAYTFLDRGKSEEEMAAFLETLSISFEFKGQTRVCVEGEDISEKIREPGTALAASRLSQNPLVRAYLTEKQREIGKEGGVVVEGRDAGSVVFPNADRKFYLDASPEERASRRHRELLSKGMDSDVATVKNEMEKRDRDDSQRSIAPLVIPSGSIVVDTTGTDAKGAVEKLLRIISGAGA